MCRCIEYEADRKYTYLTCAGADSFVFHVEAATVPRVYGFINAVIHTSICLHFMNAIRHFFHLWLCQQLPPFNLFPSYLKLHPLVSAIIIINTIITLPLSQSSPSPSFHWQECATADMSASTYTHAVLDSIEAAPRKMLKGQLWTCLCAYCGYILSIAYCVDC